MTTLKIEEQISSSSLFKEAFTHKSLSSKRSFERLEFLGDAFLSAYITQELYFIYSESSEGDLSRLRSALVSQKNLSLKAQSLGLQNHLICSKDQRSHLIKNERILASLFESYIAALYLEEGQKSFVDFLKEQFKRDLKEAFDLFRKQDAKTLFQEKAQALYKKTPTYKNQPKAQGFLAWAFLGEEKLSEGFAVTIKEAEQKAAKKALELIGEKDG